MTILIMISFLFFGIAAYQKLPVSDLPNIDLPTIQVDVSYPGANPETMANAVATPLEQQFMTIEGVQSLFSSSNTGSTSIILNFNLERDIDAASTDVAAAISRALPMLPSNLPNNPTYEKMNPAATPILWLALIAPNMTMAQLYDYANTFIGQKISMIEGVANVQIYGSPYAVRIQVDPEKLAGMQIGLDEVSCAISSSNVNLPLGTLYGEREDLTIDVDGQVLRAEGYEELVIKNKDGRFVKIKDIGRALDSVQNDKFFQSYLTREKNTPCIILGVQRLPNENTVRVIQNIDETLRNIKPLLPASLLIERVYDKSDSIHEAVADVEWTLLVAFALVVLIIYLSLGKGLNTVIPCLALPLAVFGTFAFLFLFQFSIDILSLLALTLSIGFLVDDAVVVLENTVRHVQLGVKPYEAALLGAKETSLTVLSMTLSLVAAFLPMLLMGGVIGKLFREFASTIIAAVLISGFISLTLTPMLASRFIKASDGQKKGWMERMSHLAFEKLKALYAPCLHFAMSRRTWMLWLGLSSVAGSIGFALWVPKDFLPPDDIDFLTAYTTARDGTSPYQMLRYHDEIDQIILEDPGVDSIISYSSYTNTNEGAIFIRLKPFKKRRSMYAIIGDLSEKLRKLPGINTYLSPLPLVSFQIGTTASALYQYALASMDRKSLYQYAPQLVGKLSADAHFTQVSSDLRNHQPYWQMHILRDKASNYHVDPLQIESLFGYAYSNNKISQINAPINQYQVLIETLPSFYQSPEVLSQLYVRSQKKDLVPLSTIVEPRLSAAPLTINHINGMSAVGISFNLNPDVSLDTALKKLQELTRDKPPHIIGKVVGTADIFTQSFKDLKLLLFLSFFIIYVILGILYESFIHPLTVMSALPPVLFGGLATLLVFGESLSIYSFVGLMLLVGIVLKNGIMMVDFAIASKKPPLEAITQAALIRFRPILMTTCAALMGAVPIALGIGGGIAQNRISLGLCVIGGLLVSQLLTLLLTPVLYYYFEILREKFR